MELISHYGLLARGSVQFSVFSVESVEVKTTFKRFENLLSVSRERYGQ